MNVKEQILWTACVTPFNQDGSGIDYESLERLLRYQEQAGAGIVLLGSTGEGLSLTDQERREIVTFACKLNLKTEILVGVPSHNFIAAQEWLEFCNDMPINGYLMTTPIYTKPGVQGQTKWFEALLDKSKHLAMLYNIPGRAAIKLHTDVIKNLQSHEKFWAIKDSSGTIESLAEYKIAAPNIAVFCGDDYMMPAMAAMGGAGLVSVVSNAWPAATKLYVQLCLNGQKLKSKIWYQVCKAVFSASNPIPIKVLLSGAGLISYETVRLPLSALDLPNRKELAKYHEIMMNWKP